MLIYLLIDLITYLRVYLFILFALFFTALLFTFSFQYGSFCILSMRCKFHLF